MKIGIIGVGYVGLVSGVCLASKGHHVRCFDINKNIINQLSSGTSHIYEPGLDNLLKLYQSNIKFSLLNEDVEKEILNFDAVFIAVGTPTINESIDLSQIKNVAQMLGKILKNSNHYISIIIKSTVIPGTTDTIFKEILEKESGKKIGDFGIGMNPEFLREGSAINDFQFPDRIVFGFEDSKTLDILKNIYAPWDCEKIETNTRSAEMMKYVNNALLATLISTVNEYSNVARKIGNIDFKKVMHGVHMDNRWSPINNEGNKIIPKIIDYLKPGCGFGGSCFPKDLMALSNMSEQMGIPSQILSSVISVNEKQPKMILDILKNKVGRLDDKKIILLGLSFKPDTDDVRESISLKLLQLLKGEVKSLFAHDPISIPNSIKFLGKNNNIEFVKDWKKILSDIDIIIIATNWSEYKDLKNIGKALEGKIVFDTRSLFVKGDLNANYFTVN